MGMNATFEIRFGIQGRDIELTDGELEMLQELDMCSYSEHFDKGEAIIGIQVFGSDWNDGVSEFSMKDIDTHCARLELFGNVQYVIANESDFDGYGIDAVASMTRIADVINKNGKLLCFSDFG
jgi:hypothetical protein